MNDVKIGEYPTSEDNKIEDTPVYAENAYLWHEGELSLISDGHDDTFTGESSSVKILGMTASGSDVFFTTGDPLVLQDTDTEKDIYDARVDGGFPAPVEPSSCSGDACQGAPGPVTAFGAPSSTTVTGTGNLAAPATTTPPVTTTTSKKTVKKESLKCSRGKKPSHGRCVKVKVGRRQKPMARKISSKKRRGK